MADSTVIEMDVEFEWLIHLPYTPNLAPIDLCMFPAVKTELRGRTFENLDQLRCTTPSIIEKYDFF